MTNLVAPDLEAVNKSPVPLLSTTRAAKAVLAEAEAAGCVPERILPAILKVADEVETPPIRRS
jgi:hypothetical protein